FWHLGGDRVVFAGVVRGAGAPLALRQATDAAVRAEDQRRAAVRPDPGVLTAAPFTLARPGGIGRVAARAARPPGLVSPGTGRTDQCHMIQIIHRFSPAYSA